jgi:hypothetical protein
MNAHGARTNITLTPAAGTWSSSWRISGKWLTYPRLKGAANPLTAPKTNMVLTARYLIAASPAAGKRGPFGLAVSQAAVSP